MSILSTFESEETLAAARAFAALSDNEKAVKIADAARKIRPHCESFSIDKIAVDFLESGLFDELLSMPSSHIKRVEDVWMYGLSTKETMILVSLTPEREPFHFAPTDDLSFIVFHETLSILSESTLEDDDLDLVKALYRHVARYASTNNGHSYEYEIYFAFVVLAMNKIHGRHKVISMLDRVTSQQSVTSLEFIRLFETDVDLDEVPISWALNL